MGIADRPSSRLGRKYQWIPGGRATAKPGPNNPPVTPGPGGPGNPGTPSPPGGGGPKLTSPTGTATGPDTADLSVSTNGSNGTLYFVVSTSSTAPTKAQVKAGLMHTGAAAADSGSQAVSGNGVQNITGGATGLTPETVYFAHYMHERANGSQSGVATSASFETEAAGDPSFASVVFLGGLDGADGATTYSDEKNGRAATFIGNAQLDTADFKFGTASLLSDGTGDGISFADSADWDLSDANSDPFTIELWAKTTTTTPTNSALVWQAGAGGTLSFAFWVETTGSGQLTFWGSTALGSFDWTVTASGMTWATGTWYHIAVDKDAAGKVRLYRDGVMVGSGTPADSTLANSTQPLCIGIDGSSSRSWPGWIDEVRITKGVARYASDGGYVVPTEAFPRS